MMKNTKLMALMSSAALVAAIGITGCGAQKQATTDTTTKTEATAPAEPKAEAPAETKKEAPAAQTETTATKSDASSTNATTSTQNQYVGEEAARDAALAKAGLSAADVTELKIELDADDAVVHYDVDFKSGGQEYDVDVDATTGEIITYNVEVDD